VKGPQCYAGDDNGNGGGFSVAAHRIALVNVKPVQCGGNGNITEKNVKSRPCVNTWDGALCERDATLPIRHYAPTSAVH
jgi:hypothetical protein